MFSRTVAYTSLAALAILNVLLSRWVASELRQYLVRRPPPFSHYTWIEDDVPERLALTDPRPNVKMSFEESVHYGIHESQSYWEWLYIATREDQGNIRMGPNSRYFNVAMTHQQHCLRYFRKVLDEEDYPLDLHHAEHCLSVLREHTLCAADASLEPGDPFSRNFTMERVTAEHQCMDVEAFHATMWQLWLDWLVVRDAHQEEERRQAEA